MRISAKRASTEAHVHFPPIASFHVISVPLRQQELSDHFHNRETFDPSLGCAYAEMADVMVWVIIYWCCAYANHSPSGQAFHLSFNSISG